MAHRLVLAVGLAVALAACSAPPRPAPAPPPDPAPPTAPAAASPRLVVLLVVDHLPAWAFAAKRPALEGGFDRLLREGEWHTGLHPSGATLTAPGHALLGTGEPTAGSGIPGNEWWDRGAGRLVQSIEGDGGAAASSRWLRVPGLGDAVAAAGTGAKAVSVSLKDRAAILMLGHAGTPIWYDRKRVAWTSTAPLAWLDGHNARAPIAARLASVWTPLDPERLARLAGVPDANPGEVGDQGFGPTFPHALGATRDPAAALRVTPLGNELVLDAALAALAAEQLGADDAPDLLAISLSAHDYIAHAWGHESWEAWDALLRLDAQLARFLDELDAKVGAGRWALVATSDHGGSPLPARLGGGHLRHAQLVDAANRAAITVLGPGSWIAAAKYPTVYLSAAALARAPKDVDRALAKIVLALRAFPGLERVERTASFAGGCAARTGDARVLCQMLDPERSGEVFYLPRRGWIIDDSDQLATAHGSLHAYDREVPVILLPPGRAAHAPLAAPSASPFPMTRVAPLVAGWLGVAPPPSLPRAP